MSPSDLKSLLARHGIKPIRGRGQNFLLDERVAAAMAEAAGAGPALPVLEIGPGPGLLTEKLLAKGAEVVAVELDGKLCALLRERFTSAKFHLLQGDALSFSNAALASSFFSGKACPCNHLELCGCRDKPCSYALAANLPYNITSAALQKFLLEEPRPVSLTVMVQREVAERILAGTGEMSALAVMVQTMGKPRRLLQVPRSSFHPQPKVDSTVIHIAVRSAAELDDFFGPVRPERYFSLVRAAFAQKRKKLKNSLTAAIPAEMLERALFEAKIKPDARPEELTPADWLALAKQAG